MSPLVPTAFDVIWAVAVTLHVILVVAALISLSRAADTTKRFGTVLFIVFVPFVGPILSLIAHRSAPSRPERI
jgi:hypothetical protein